MTSRDLITYATATAQDLLEANPFYDAVNCDFTTISVAWIRFSRTSVPMTTGDFKVRGIPFPAVNFSAVLMVLLPFPRDEGERRTLAPFAAYLRANGITHIRVVGQGAFDRRYQFTRNHGVTWGNIPVQQPAPTPAPAQVLDAPIPPPPAPDDDRPLWGD